MRHKLAKDEFNLSTALSTDVRKAVKLEAETQWFAAGEHYLKSAEAARDSGSALDAVRALARAAHCFELVGQHRDAAEAYSGAGALLVVSNDKTPIAGELYNRAARCFSFVSDFFSAGQSYRQAASAFAQSANDTIVTNDDIPPVPSAAGRYTVAGICLSAAGDSFVKSGDLPWARSSYWESGTMHVKQGYGYPAYVSFQKALLMCIRFDHTLDPVKLRNALPLTDDERKDKVDPFAILENAAQKANSEHQRRNSGLLDSNWSRNTTDEQMISSYHEFYLELLQVGNPSEAGRFYVQEMQRRLMLHVRHRNYISAVAYLVWELTSKYGESPRRWFCLAVATVLIFALLYGAFGWVAPISGWFDYIYFSIVTITTLGYGDIHPVNVMGKLASSAEVVSGILLFGLFLNLLTRKFMR